MEEEHSTSPKSFQARACSCHARHSRASSRHGHQFKDFSCTCRHAPVLSQHGHLASALSCHGHHARASPCHGQHTESLAIKANLLSPVVLPLSTVLYVMAVSILSVCTLCSGGLCISLLQSLFQSMNLHHKPTPACEFPACPVLTTVVTREHSASPVKAKEAAHELTVYPIMAK